MEMGSIERSGLRALEEEMLVTFHKLQEVRRQRLRLQRVWEPESFNWRKRGAPPPETWSTALKKRAWEELGLGRTELERLKEQEAALKDRLSNLLEEHPLCDVLLQVEGLGSYLAASLIAVAGIPHLAENVTNFWSAMGVGLVPVPVEKRARIVLEGETEQMALVADLATALREMEDARMVQMTAVNGHYRVIVSGPARTLQRAVKPVIARHPVRVVEEGPDFDMRAPRKERGQAGIPCPPYVPLVGEQLRAQLLKQNKHFYSLYQHKKGEYLARGWSRMRAHKAAQRFAQKLFYYAFWKEWRACHGLPAPDPYYISILGHTSDISLADFFRRQNSQRRQRG
jgi:hypothetical protein